MANKKNTRRALFMSVMSLILCCAMLMGTTFAWFTDSVTSTNNRIQSGTLDIALEMWDGTQWTDVSETSEPIFEYDKWEPGYTQIVHLRVINKGTLHLKWQAKMNTTNQLSALADVINVYVKSDDKADTVKAAIEAIDARPSEKPDAYAEPNFHKFTLSQFAGSLTAMTQGVMAPAQESYLSLVLEMDPSAGNEYQNKDLGGIFDLVIEATQNTVEVDTFGPDYDEDATYVSQPMNISGSAPVDAAVTYYEIPLTNVAGGKVGSASIPAEAVAAEAEDLYVTFVETNVNPAVPVASNKDAKTYDITVTGLKDNNDKVVKIEVTIEAGLSNVQVYHNETPIEAVYNSDTGKLIIESKSFSPFTLVFDAKPVENEGSLEQTVPVAVVTDADEFENVALGWTGWGGYNPAAGAEQKLDSVYKFQSPDTSESVENSIYRNWYCDYYVKFVPADNTMTVLPEGSITLGGNYGGYSWVGFDNPEVEVNTFIPLLGSVLGNCDEEGTTVDTGWTYEAVVDLVKEFWCGVAEANGNTVELNGSKFVVELRLTNPTNYDDYIAVNTVTYTFGTGESVIESYNAQ